MKTLRAKKSASRGLLGGPFARYKTPFLISNKYFEDLSWVSFSNPLDLDRSQIAKVAILIDFDNFSRFFLGLPKESAIRGEPRFAQWGESAIRGESAMRTKKRF